MSDILLASDKAIDPSVAMKNLSRSQRRATLTPLLNDSTVLS